MAGELEKIQKWRTLAIISHPDAGKATLTKKLSFYSGAINLAGSVKGKKAGKRAVSGWMDIGKERGIPVTSSVLQFNYEDFRVNILDTPEHEGFSEDAHHTLMAVDSAIMVIDISKGAETQTQKLSRVCTLRHTPIFTFINKMNHEARDPSTPTDKIEELLGIRTCPASQPIGSGKNFEGVFDRNTGKITVFQAAHADVQEIAVKGIDFSDPALGSVIGEDYLAQLTEETELPDGVNDEFDMARVSRGDLTPVFFGSALANSGVETFLEHFLKTTTSPLPQKTKSDEVSPMKNPFFSAFVFKTQADMNKARRDRIAFMRICSGECQAGIEVTHAQGKRKVRLNQSMQMTMGEQKTVETAYADDITGAFDPGIFAIGDTLESVREPIAFGGIPTFAPEHFAYVHQIDTMKHKQFTKGIEQIAQEGAIQIFREHNTGMEEIIIGVVSVLQFEMLTYRLKVECNVEVRLDTLPYECIRWIDEPETMDIDKVQGISDMKLIQSLKGEPLLLLAYSWNVRMVEERNPGLRFLEFGKS